jgi:glycolate oxidase iron-sulfur subunit
LGERKVKNILASGAQLVVTGNIGCLVQIRTHLNTNRALTGAGIDSLPVLHTVELLDRAYRGIDALN